MKRLIVALLLLPGCACWQAAHAQDPKCVIANQVLKCTEGAGANLIPVVAGIIAEFVIGQPSVDWADLEQRLEAAGFKDAVCVIEALKSDYVKGTEKAKTDVLTEMQHRIMAKHGVPADTRVKYEHAK